jgi:hypothetical protein
MGRRDQHARAAHHAPPRHRLTRELRRTANERRPPSARAALRHVSRLQLRPTAAERQRASENRSRFSTKAGTSSRATRLLVPRIRGLLPHPRDARHERGPKRGQPLTALASVSKEQRRDLWPGSRSAAADRPTQQPAALRNDAPTLLIRLRARREQVALADRRVQARVGLDQGQPPAPADPARDAPLRGSLPSPRRCRARVRTPEERVGARAASRPWAGSGSAARRSDDPRQARLRAQSGASGSARGVGPKHPRGLSAGRRPEGFVVRTAPHLLRPGRCPGVWIIPRIRRQTSEKEPDMYDVVRLRRPRASFATRFARPS